MKRGGGEHEELLDVFFDRKDRYAEEGVQRRKTLALLLDLSSALQQAGAGDLDENAFRIGVYGRMPLATMSQELRKFPRLPFGAAHLLGAAK